MRDRISENMLPLDSEYRNPENTTDIKSGLNYLVWRAPRLYPDQFQKLPAIDRLNYLSSLGHLAPNTHNSQPWAFQPRENDNSISIFLDKNRVLPASDIFGRQSCISLGCALENIIIGARYFSYSPEIKLENADSNQIKPLPVDKEVRYLKLAEIKFQIHNQEIVIPRDRFESIFTRKVNRSEYVPNVPINPELIQACEISAKLNNVTLTLLQSLKITERARIRIIAEAQKQADSYVVNDDKFREELSRWFLPNDTENFLGMPGDTFNLPDKQAQEVVDELNGKKTLDADTLIGFSSAGKKGIETAPLVGIISVKEDIAKNWISAGIVLQEIALIMEENRFALAIHAGLAEVDWVSKSIIRALTLKEERPVILFRAGKAKEERLHSPRLPFKDVIIT